MLGDPVDRAQWAGDASIYHLIPRVVVIPRDVEEVQSVLAIAAAERVPVCFRAGGTSLSGQAVTDGILIVISRHLRGIRVHPGAEHVSCGPGAVGAWVNAALAPHGRRIGPDPASIQAAEIGGIVANNASGMCCGVADNSYHTVTGLDLVLADGWRLDTSAPDADTRMERERPALAAGLRQLAADLRSHPVLPGQVAKAFATKNTVGYSLNALLDADTPARILQKLVVGSEGTLAFIAEATFRTLPLPRFRATAWLLFRDVEEASRAVAPLAALEAKAIELLDAVALLRVADELPHALPAGEPAALLVEFQEADETQLLERVAAAGPVLLGFDLAAPAAFTRDAKVQADYWHIRKGLFPSVGAVRAAGTAVVIEDVTFPVDRLAEGVRRLRGCFAAHGYGDAVIFGHAKDGNLHFTLTPDLAQPAEVQRYDAFMQAMVDCVLDMGGHLKAEHGTGRNIAPFVARQWGTDAMALMRRIKALLDPLNLFNPGVLLSDDPQAHLKHLKTLPPVDALVDRCIECGFCEPVCPSRDVTYSPRQRIAALRAAARGGADAKALRSAWNYRGLATCAADGMCETACPVHINTGDLVKAERAARQPALARWAAAVAERNFTLVAGATRLALGAARFIGIRRMPGSPITLPAPARALPHRWPVAEPGAPTLVYFPTCLGRMFGDDDLPGSLAALCAAAGVGLVVPADAGGLCCGQPFASKGFPATADAAARRVADALLTIAHGDALVVTDTSTCASQLDHTEHALPDAQRPRWRALRRLHPAQAVMEILAPRLRERGRLTPGDDALVLHPTCSEHRHGWTSTLRDSARALSTGTVTLPMSAGCCGMAGDKGWTTPELTAGATAREAAEATGSSCGVATSATCAAALTAASSVTYRHLFALLAERLTGSASHHDR